MDSGELGLKRMKTFKSTRPLLALILLILMLAVIAVGSFISARIDTHLIVNANKEQVRKNLESLHWFTSQRSDGNSTFIDEPLSVLQSFAKQAQHQDYRYLIVTDILGNIVASNREEQIGKHWTELSPTPSGLGQFAGINEPNLIEEIETHTLIGTLQSCISVSSANASSRNCHLLYIEADLAPQFAAHYEERVNGLLLTSALTFAAVLLILILFSITIAGRSAEIIKHVGEFKRGNRKVRIPVRGFGEFALLSDSVNHLFDEIEEDEQAISEKNTRYESLIDTMADGLITVQEDGTIESMNFAAERLLGFRQKELVGSNISLLVTDPEAANAKKFLNSFIEQEGDEIGNTDREVEIRTKDAEVLSMRLSMSKMNLAEDSLFIGVLSDISRITAMEKELRALNKELSETNEQLEQTVITDGLTGLYNRRHFDSMFTKELQRSTRQRTSISLLVVDIDFFKQFNDRYGHALGDECLTNVAQCIKSVFKRSGDLPARYGGEEFAIILPGCDGLELQERAETLRLGIYDLQIPHSSSRADQVVTVSVGAVTYKPASKEVVAPKPRELFTEADKALYRAKASGRNRVVLAGQYQPIPILSTPGNYYGHLIARY